ncbi:TreTu family toxin [Paenibacillus nasutitermitis]|uniref:TreTu toxin C-terminal domain-containing protein n=1 Tax=Paenibacillus nasutitermitis TaxID=1652958 RepID=A0A916Z845_9BACL|nr:hypothetical protein [Paenibacillus nasutitermitis]GGD79015.1 hypothetical protein GCM10010911_41370 [Paenibacillus nasutitermitis]
MESNPNWYTIGNWATLGTFDTVKGTFAPEKPLSLQHWIDSGGTVLIVTGPLTSTPTKVTTTVAKSAVDTTRVGQWMSKSEYNSFLKTGEIPRTNVLTKGKGGYEKQADKGDYYVEFDINPSLLMTKDADLGWSLVKSKNQTHLKLAEKKGITLPAPIGTNIKHVDTKRRR